ncbi:uncharacterized protein LOC110433872 [Sorghum bicolor]|nr:uncharacterized protein LOC110433872 [Sorghum bicolor]|eukprot:XP_021312438.1 uncharacterized protein LOC110433872 [Sorghum bicolor]
MWEKKLLEEVKVWMWKVVVSFHLKTWKGTQWQADQVLASRLTTHLKPLPPFTDTSATVLDRAGGGGDAWSRGWERRCMALRMAAVARGRARSGAGKGDQAWARSGLGAGGGAGMGMCEPRGPRVRFGDFSIYFFHTAEFISLGREREVWAFIRSVAGAQL